MTGRQKADAEEKKMEMYYEAGCRCFRCNRLLHFHETELAHVIPKGYAWIYGREVIHHKKNMKISCSKCNSYALMDPKTHPIECEKLIQDIRNDIDES